MAMLTAALAETRQVELLLFVTTDCPIANAYAPEIARICREYASRGVGCRLVYSDSSLSDADIRQHQAAFGLSGIPAVADRDHAIAKRAGAAVTPEAAVMEGGKLLYRGRIDDRYVAWGKARVSARQRDLRRALDELAAGKTVTVERTKAVGCYITFTRER